MSLIKASRFMSLILRHKPESIGITLDEHGWADVEELIEGISKKYPFDMQILEEIVRTDDKQRYSFNEDKTHIRANQGHSIPVDVELEIVEPPEFLWHGTGEKYTESIEKMGLIPKSRLYVHLSVDEETAINVGKRHGRPAKREKYLPTPTNANWTSSPLGQTGDLIAPAEKLGAAFDLMDKVWGAPSIISHTGRPFFLVADRGIPSMIIVDQNGDRFLNEAMPYHEFVDTVYEHNQKTGGKAIPSWMIITKKTKKRYLFCGQFPGQDFPKEYYEQDIVRTADTVEELAKKLDMKPAKLKATVDRFNQFARNGKDEDFGRGDQPYDRYYGDPTLKNPNLDGIEEGPYYALRVFPGDIGTKGGVVVDEKARILKKDGTCIEGVYAAGNCSASVMGETYPGPGATLGPGMTFAYIAALDCKKK